MFSIRKIIAQSIGPSIYRNFARKIIQDQDPGINRRKKLLALDSMEDQDIDIEDMESDFMGSHKVHVQHEKEMSFLKEREKYLIVKQKYFKEKFPNFLTWHDKEQIRYLHRTDPQEWTIERLSEGFPALPRVIKKIVSSNWTKTKQHKIAHHDESVQKNWNLFKERKMSELPKDLVQHLNKFTNRALNLTPFVAPDTQTTTLQVETKRTSTEFADIIKSYEKLKGVPQIEDHQIVANVEDNRPCSEAYVATRLHRQKSVTLNELQQDVKKKIEMGKVIDEEEKHIARSLTEKEDITEGPQNQMMEERHIAKRLTEKEDRTERPQNQMIDLSHTKYKKAANVQNFKKTQKDFSHLIYPERITIPEDLFQKGSTYKLNDCYYDDDGEFLYRVPGMS